jgi:hypothetical protein
MIRSRATRFCRKVAISSVLASVSHGISESRFSGSSTANRGPHTIAR